MMAAAPSERAQAFRQRPFDVFAYVLGRHSELISNLCVAQALEADEQHQPPPLQRHALQCLRQDAKPLGLQ